MSKSKPKDKKNDSSSLIQKQFEAQKREMIDADFSIKRLEQKLSEKSIETQKLEQELEDLRKTTSDKIDQLVLRTNDDEKRLANQINKITDLQIKTTRYESQINSLKQQLSLEKQLRFKEVGEIKIKMDSERMKLDLQLKDLQIYLEERESRKIQLEDLREKIQFEKAERVREVADKQRQKVQATDKLRDEMLNKIRDMRTDLLSLKKQQLETTTRLTILQNHQLTSQLQYQSKQTEKLIFKDEQMQTKIKKLNQQLVIHKQVEDQLAKRAHFSKGVIKKLNQKVIELEKQLQKTREKGNQNPQSFVVKNRLTIDDSHLKDRELILSLERQLEQTERKYAQLLSKFEALAKERDNINCCLKKYEASSNDLIKILHTYYQQILNEQSFTGYDKQESEQMKDTIKISILEIRSKQVQNWTQQQLTFMVKFLLNLLRPFITKQNIMIPSIRKNIILETPIQQLPLNKSLNRLPRIPDQNGDINSIKTGKKKIQDLPVNIASKIVASNLREWGTTVRLQHNSQLKRKFKISQSYR